ncbi:TPA: hypothetical protein ACKP97_003923 [Pseudomonas aeruginosa]|uniref:hypothetical protein n=1 Tax=Pseudomonas aeruginosa TaxID=287 RepID=UPI000FDA167B|nr:hypothetical protein [Pseudomonas aeruginosa]MBG5166827.1 hypothetical protein [Pseudomonas aeruginosa]MBS9747738.1 hypothetical protein [Pseudomonas aeruginosa]MBX6656337.1 hypothetical protein [Pseudomonas aeruginosa]MBX6818010.1 hypothetical protein [Pseudomonas aeruginosa]
MRGAFVSLISTILVSGCANLNSIYRTFDVSGGEGAMVDIRQRAILVAPNENTIERYNSEGKLVEKEYKNNGVFVCAEPSPDAMASFAYELAAKGGYPGKASGELALAMQDGAAFTGVRTQSIQLLRDFGYRLCESYMSGAISAPQYDLLMRRFQKNTVALLAIEQLTGTIKPPPIALTTSGRAEATKSLSEQRAEREKVNDRVSVLETEKKALENKVSDAKKTDANADTSEMDQQVSSLADKIVNLKSDRDAIDKAIAETKGVLADGETKVKIETTGMSTQRSEAHLQQIAKTVEGIVNNIVLADDEKQLCMSALLLPSPNEGQKKFSDWCLKVMGTQAEARDYLMKDIKLKTEQAQAVLRSGASEAKKEEARNELNNIREKAEKIERGTGTYSVASELM